MIKKIIKTTILGLSLSTASYSFAADDAARGKELYNTYKYECYECHHVKAADGLDKKNRANLSGLIGRNIASQKDARYSDALKKLSNQVWTEENLTEYLRDPAKMVPGTYMSKHAISNEADLKSIVEYIKTLNE